MSTPWQEQNSSPYDHGYDDAAAAQENPWQEQHAVREAAFQDSPGIARAIVDNEYRDAPDAVPCECGGQAFYKATIGAMKCTRCGELYFTNGEKV